MPYVERLESTDATARFYRCPICGFGKVRIEASVFYGRCDECNATLIDYNPAPHQLMFHNSPFTYKLLVGGFASGKTTCACAEDARHVLSIPNARLLITAQTLQQVREAVLPELDKFLPPWLLVDGKPKGNPPVYTLVNGSEILVFASDDEQKIRSLNLTAFHIEEASGVPFAVFSILQTRLRNTAAVIYDVDGYEIGEQYLGIVSTNPEDGWISDEFLLKSWEINGSVTADVSVYDKLRVDPDKRIPAYASFVSTTFDNPYLSRGTVERISAGRNERWRRKYLYSILDSSEGLVYPDMTKCYEEPFAIPTSWLRIGGFDPGIADPTAMLFGAIDPTTKIIHFYDEYYERDKPVGYHAQQLGPRVKPYKWLYPIQADPSIKQRSKETGRSYKEYFRGVSGFGLKEANNDLLFGIEKVRNYIYEGKIRVFNNLSNFRMEAAKYKMKKNKEVGKTEDIPVDRDNHLMDCIRYAVSVLPEDPHQFDGVFTFTDLANKKSSYDAFKERISGGKGKDGRKSVFLRKFRT